MATNEQPPFMETNLGVVSVIGLNNICVGLIVAGIVGKVSFVLLVPIITSVGCTLGSGLCYYAWGSDYPVVNRAVAAVFSGVAWMIQEAGLPFYGYGILVPILCGIERIIFLTIFWGLMVVILFCRLAVVTLDTRYILRNDPSPVTLALHSTLTNRLHFAYFPPIAMAEILSAVFLLMKFRRTLRASKSGGLGGGKLYRYLMRSTEIRVASLAIIGITRSITFSFRLTVGPYRAVTQIDFFMYILESLYPIIMFRHYPNSIDILASRLIFTDENSMRNNNILST
ncbi:hsp90 co-chaperone cdc37 protein [Fusarium austroafricanum]|uniref:Hsp90 co-chaperone cdc37 protein n=1 Tax=Fusarium austroafricanum TaxID=2364996 RepID=A0A8H4JGQ9_9HYPO|nr:hsp90 co-chaperone cdc37 protein [Fusarium austroafricanum]